MNKDEPITLAVNEKTDPFILFEFIKDNLYFWQVMDLYKLLKEEILKGE